MERKPKTPRYSLGLITGISVAILAVGGVTAWWASRSITDTNTNTNQVPPTVQSQETPRVEELSAITIAEVYWINGPEENIDLTATKVELDNKSGNKSEVLTNAIEVLLAGPTDNVYSTTIPSGTKLLDITVKKDGIHINLSQEFTYGGGSASMIARLGQIIYTATSLNPDSTVWIDIEGEPLEFLGGEGAMVSQPITRQNFQENFVL